MKRKDKVPKARKSCAYSKMGEGGGSDFVRRVVLEGAELLKSLIVGRPVDHCKGFDLSFFFFF